MKKLLFIAALTLASLSVFAQESEFERGYKAGLASCDGSGQQQVTWTCNVYTKGYGFHVVRKDVLEQYEDAGRYSALVANGFLENYIASGNTKGQAMGETLKACNEYYRKRVRGDNACEVYKSHCSKE